MHLMRCDELLTWGTVKARRWEGRLHLRDSRLRINTTRLVAILALNNAAHFRCDANLEVGLILELREYGTL